MKALTVNPIAGRSSPTMADVARHCGVTEATVSGVLNHSNGGNPVSDPAGQKVLEAIRELGYVPNLRDRMKSRRNARMIGLFASPQAHFDEGINQFILEGITETLQANGYDVFFGLRSMPSGGRKAASNGRIGGAIVMQDPKPEMVSELDKQKVPYICVNERIGQPLGYVLADDVMGMNRVISHLTQLGHRRVAYANVRRDRVLHYSVDWRYQTLLQAVEEQRIELAPGHESPFDSATDFLRNTVVAGQATAMITYDHRRAVTLLGAAQAMGLRVPHDFSLICFNDTFPLAMLNPPITTVAVPGYEMGRLGSDLLLNHLHSGQTCEGREIRVAEDLIVRGSTSRVMGG